MALEPSSAPGGPAWSSPPGATSGRRALSPRALRIEHVRDYGILVFAVGIFVYFSLASPAFLTSDNLLNIVYQNATIAIPACAVTLVIIAGNFDLSVGAIFTFAEVLCAWVALHWGGWWCFPVAILAGAAMGFVNGMTVTKLKVNAFLATLATALAFGGLALAVSGGSQIIPTSTVFTYLGQNSFAGIQYPVFMVVLVAVVLQVVLAYTAFGGHLYGVGGNPDAARLAGLSVDRLVIATFVIAGAACGIAGLLDASMTSQGSATNSLGDNLALQAIAGVALGGTSIFGGVGSVWRTLVGVLMLGMITNGFNLLGVPSFWQDIVRGLLIVVAVVISMSVGRLGRSPALGEP
jgi:ribose transport system permease protein